MFVRRSTSLVIVAVAIGALSLLGGGAGAQATPVVVDLGEQIHDIQADPTSGRVYVSVPRSNAVVALDAATGTELDRVTLTDPRGLAVSSDGSTVYVALATEGAVARWTVASGEVVTTLLPELGHLRTWDVLLIDDATLAVAANGWGCVVIVDLSTDARSCAAGGTELATEAALERVGDRLFVGERDRYSVLDLATSGVPIVETGFLTTSSHFGVTHDGNTIIGQNQVIDVRGGIQRGMFHSDEVPYIDRTGRLLTAEHAFDGVSATTVLLERNVDTLEAVRSAEVECPVVNAFRVGALAAGGPGDELAISFGSQLCLAGSVALAPIVEPPLRSGPAFDLGHSVRDAVVDEIAGRAYLSLTQLDQVVVIDTATGDEVDRQYFHRPSGIALSPDGSTVHVALSASQAVAHWNLSTGLVATRPILELTDPRVSDVIEPRPGVVVVSGDGTPSLVAIDMATGVVRPVGGNTIRGGGSLAADADSLYLGTGGSPQSLYKLDLNDPAMPIVLEDRHGSVSGTNRVRPEPDGSLLLGSGQRITSDSFLATAWFGSQAERGSDGYVYTAGTEVITRHDPVSSEPLATIAFSCPVDPVTSPFPRWVLHTDSGFLLILDQALDNDMVCLLADPVFEPVVTAPFALGPNAELSAELSGVAVDVPGGRAYVSTSEGNRVSVIDLVTGDEIGRRFFRWPSGVDVSSDGSRLYVSLGAASGIAVWDLATDTVEYLFFPELGGSGTADVVVLADDRVVIRPGHDGLSFMVTYDPVAGTATPSIDRLTSFGQGLLDVGDGRVLVGSHGIFDIAAGTLTRAPTFTHWTPGSVVEPGRETMLTTGGERIDLSTFEVIRTTDIGRPVYTDDGSLFMYEARGFLRPRSTMRQHDPRTLQEVATAPVPCQLGGSASVTSTGPGRFFLAGGHWSCVVDGVSPEPSFVRATTNPALPSQVVVDGVSRDTWGLTWAEIGTGIREICFTDVVGYTTPPCADVEVGAGTTVYEGTFVERGWIRATSDPPVPTTIAVDGFARNDWGAWVDVEPGTHEVCWGDVEGFGAPACQDVEVIAGQTVDAVGTFTPDASPAPTGHGFLRVTTDPPVGSMITVDGVERDRWGLTWMKVPAGRRTVCFGDVSGFATPQCQSVFVFDGVTGVVIGTFEPLGSLRVTTEPAVPATVIIDGVPRNDWGMWTEVPPGPHEVCWQTVGGTAPECVDVVVEAGVTTTAVGQWPQ